MIGDLAGLNFNQDNGGGSPASGYP